MKSEIFLLLLGIYTIYLITFVLFLYLFSLSYVFDTSSVLNHYHYHCIKKFVFKTCVCFLFFLYMYNKILNQLLVFGNNHKNTYMSDI